MTLRIVVKPARRLPRGPRRVPRPFCCAARDGAAHFITRELRRGNRARGVPRRRPQVLVFNADAPPAHLAMPRQASADAITDTGRPKIRMNVGDGRVGGWVGGWAARGDAARSAVGGATRETRA